MNWHGHIISSTYDVKNKKNLRNNNFVAVSITIYIINC